MVKILFTLIIACIFLFPWQQAHAVENPLAVANNKVGVHLLDPSELENAAELINSSGGDWGYVIVPIQAGDKDIIKWQKFMNDCKKLHVIPLIRLATEGDHFNTQVWREPTYLDVIDFANFLNSLEWPTKNRYIVVFNEVNRADEWGGQADPKEYAQILGFSVSIFKSKSQDFFMISAGMDNAAPEQGTVYMNQYNYLKRMNEAVPGIFNQVDGISSHSYPNPAFARPPDTESTMGTGSFIHERALINTMTKKNLPVFITETGWSAEEVTEEMRVRYYEEAFKNVWSDNGVVTVIPFLLRAGAGPFEKFTFITADGYKTKQYEMIKNMKKVKGVPSLPTRVLAAETSSIDSDSSDLRDFSDYQKYQRSISLRETMQNIFNYLIGN